MRTPDLNEISAHIQSMKKTANALNQLGADFPAIHRNIVRILASIKMLEINICDIVELGDDSKS
jgi:hypothetical protein